LNEVNPQFLAQVRKIRDVIDELDYFQLLRVPYEANDVQIRAGYHRQAKAFHPDRYAYLGDDPLRQDLMLISKRVTEAYVVLRDAPKRQSYLAWVQGPERIAHLRFDESHEGQERERQAAQGGTTAQGRNLWAQAQAARGRGDHTAALQSLRLAAAYEPDNAWFKEQLAAWTQEPAS
jgi:DnaJ-class molecular chaperone